MKKVRVNRPRLPEFQSALRRAEESVSEPQPLCGGKDDAFVHYSASPSQDEAESMCRTVDDVKCPLYELCRKSAKVERPAWGVQGGIAWDMGRQVHWVKALRAAKLAAEKVAA